MNVVSIPKATELFLTGSVPAVKTNLATVSSEVQRVDLNTNRRCNTKPSINNESHQHVKISTDSISFDRNILDAIGNVRR